MTTDVPQASKIEAIIFDVDGVLTDGGLYRSDDGQESKRFHAMDGLGIRMLVDHGIEVAIITGRTSELLKHRCQELKIKHLYQGQENKLSAFEDLCQKLDMKPDALAYMGDDIIDLPIMRRVGLAMTVPDACDEIVAIAHWTSKRRGGNGAAREACELILKATGKYEEATARFRV